MRNTADFPWFRQPFYQQIQNEVVGPPFSLGMLSAIACKKSGYLWQILCRKQLSVRQIQELCVGDIIDESGGRIAFPNNKDALVAKPNRQMMFDIARKALEGLAENISGYQPSVANLKKFCHSFGIFQYNLQFFLKDSVSLTSKEYWAQINWRMPCLLLTIWINKEISH